MPGPEHGEARPPDAALNAESGADGGTPGSTGSTGDQQAAGDGSSGDQAARATSSPGRGSRLYDTLRDYERQTFQGDQVFGAKNYFFGGARPAAGPSQLPADLVEAVRNAFVDPEGWAHARDRARGRAVVILSGREGWGKQGAAIRLLLAAPRRQLFQLDQDLAFGQLAEHIREGLGGRPGGGHVGFLLDQPRRIAELTGPALQRVEEILKQAGAQLVLTIGSGVAQADADLARFVIDLTGPPDFPEVTARHLAHQVGEDHAVKLLDEPAVRQYLADYLTEEPSCSLAFAMATELAAEYLAAADGGEFSIDRVRAGSQRHVRGVDGWFAGLPDTRSRCLAISLAVLSGSSYESVAKAARALLARFAPAAPAQLIMPAGDDIAPEGMRPFRIARRDLLQMLRAHLADAEHRGMYGTSRSEIVTFEDLGFAARVLRHAWSGFDVQDVLIDWLRELAEDESEQTRVRAGLALGQLAAWSFEYLCDGLLVPWASSEVAERREAVAYALRRVVTADEQLRKQARFLALGWYASREHPPSQATAARAYGLALGTFDPDAAIAALTRLLVVDDVLVSVNVGKGLADLLAPAVDQAEADPDLEPGERVRAVLTQLMEAAADRERSLATQVAFLVIAIDLVTDVRSPDAGDVEWPAVLWLADQLAECRRPVVALWRHCLDSGEFPGPARQVMTSWARYAEADPQVRAAYLRLARAIARGHPRCRSILGRYADLWLSAENLMPLPEVSQALQAVLAAESEVA